jgi:hypothetical protein
MARDDKVLVRLVATGEALIAFMVGWLVLARVMERLLPEPTAAVVAMAAATAVGAGVGWLMAAVHSKTLHRAIAQGSAD